MKKNIEFFLERGIIDCEGNAIFAEKAFVVNSVINFLMKNHQEETMTKKYIHYLAKFIKDEIQFKWDDGNLIILQNGEPIDAILPNDKNKSKNKSKNKRTRE